jgi:NAD+ kinase
MKRVAVVGKSLETHAQLCKELEKYGFVYDEKNPDLVLSYGGDGTFLRAEAQFPEVPKVLIRDSKICVKCHNLPTEHVLTSISKGKFSVIKYKKIEAHVDKRFLTGINEVTVRNKTPVHALRFELFVDGKQIDGEIIGDGVTVATVFGASGYFYSITRRVFYKGLGIAFNNSTKPVEPVFIPDSSMIEIVLTRGEAIVAVDHEMLEVKEGKIVVNASKKFATILQANI